jgi:hypothetical protein
MSFEPNVLIPAINTAFSHICLVTGNGDDFTARMFNAIHGMLLDKWRKDYDDGASDRLGASPRLSLRFAACS